MPEGSVWYRRGTLLPLSKPTIMVLMPKGRTPPLCVYRCWTPATYLVMYSMDAGSSTVSLWDCASNRALSTRMRASALRPAKARQTWVSRSWILDGVIRVSCSFMADRFSHPSTTTSLPLTPTAQVPVGPGVVSGWPVWHHGKERGGGGGVPLLTASPAYSTWKTCPSGLREGQRRGCFGAVASTDLKTGGSC
jgi:hypothetical protein